MGTATVHVCSECGFHCAQWLGQCPGCEAWNTLLPERPRAAGAGAGARGRFRRAAQGGPGARGSAPRPLREVGAQPLRRLPTGIGELDRVLGGGLVPGSLVLLGGSPGIGKSTLTNMVLGHLQGAGLRTLYISGEESAEQVRLRAERLVADHERGARAEHPALRVPVLAETDLDAILQTLEAEAPQVCVIDSVQTLRSAELSGAPGSVGQ